MTCRFLIAIAPLLLVSSRGAAQSRPALPAKPRLVVHVAVDQLRPDYLDAYAGQFTGGFARLLRGGAYFPNGFQDHGITETAPGHSTMMAGRFPRGTGIVANDAGVLDIQSPLVGAPGDPASSSR